MKPIKVLIVDNNEVFLKSAVEFLSTLSIIGDISEFQSGIQALNEITEYRFDLVLIDYVMPIMDGAQITRLIKKVEDPPRVIIISQFKNRAYESLAVASGADGFISKSEFVDELPPLIEKLFRNSPK